jgi:ATP-binding cassette subfamily B protein/subfamily B ATP-binding cassette protein MsbA
MMSFLNPFLDPFFSQEPALLLIRKTARDQWKLIVLNLGCNLVGALSEGATLGVVFLAVKVLSASDGPHFDWAGVPLLGSIPLLVNRLSALPTTGLFLSLLGVAVLLQILQSFMSFLIQLSTGYFAARCKTLVTAQIHTQVLSLSFPCASNYKVGDLTDYASQGPMAIRIQIDQISTLLVSLILCVMYFLVLMRISPLLLLAVLFIGSTITLLQKNLLPRIRSGAQAVTSSELSINTRITEDFQGLRLLHATGQLDVADQRVRSVMGELESRLRAQSRRLSVVGPISSVLPILAIALMAAVSVLLLDGNGRTVLPSLVTFVLALQKLNGRINIMNTNLNLIADNSGRLQRLNGILSTKDKQFRRINGIPFVELKDSIVFDNVSLRYSQELPPALSEISFKLPKGQFLALVGASGAGKSSIADLLTGLYSPTLGRILIDGKPLEKIDLASWQQRLGVVSQDTFLFNATIADNIAFGTPGATQAQIESACRSAQASGFIENLAQGYDTLVGERGYRLSGGQRQRLSLARAILRNPDLLILDEATSALDSESERLVQQAIERFERNHSVLVIAHRLSTIVRADQIIVLDSGRIIERGTHKSLFAAGGTYRNMWIHQDHDSQPVVN